MLRKDWNYRRGDIYLADLGEHRGNIQGGVRPVINIQNNSGNFFGPTLIVVPLMQTCAPAQRPATKAEEAGTAYTLRSQKAARSE